MTQRRIYSGVLTDNCRWDHIALRPDDVLVVTPAKAGTTWMQTIVALLFTGDPEVETNLSVRMPWVDIKVRDIDEVAARLNAIQTRRSMKSHTPMDGLPLHDHAQYLCVCRHPLDVHFSFRNHVRNTPLDCFDPWYPDPDPQGATFEHFLDGPCDGPQCDAVPLAHIVQHYTAAKALAARENITLFHYADMTRDLPGTMARVADLLGISHAAPLMERLAKAATFENMKRHAARFAPAGGKGFFKSDSAFFQSGSGRKWQGRLTDAELNAYAAAMDALLSPQDRRWLEFGAHGA